MNPPIETENLQGQQGQNQKIEEEVKEEVENRRRNEKENWKNSTIDDELLEKKMGAAD